MFEIENTQTQPLQPIVALFVWNAISREHGLQCVGDTWNGGFRFLLPSRIPNIQYTEIY